MKVPYLKDRSDDDIWAYSRKQAEQANAVIIPAVNRLVDDGCDARAILVTLMAAAVLIQRQRPDALPSIEQVLTEARESLAKSGR